MEEISIMSTNTLYLKEHSMKEKCLQVQSFSPNTHDSP